jgi:hypothetical protein
MIENILAKASLKDLYGKKPLKVPNKPLDARKDTLGVLVSDNQEAAPQGAASLSWEDLNAMLDQEIDIPGKLALLEDEELTEDALVGLTAAYDQIRAMRPVNQSTTLFGIDDRAPSRSEQSSFNRKMEVFNNPRVVIDLLNAGQLSGLEVDTLKQFYPNYYQSLVENVLDQLASNKEPLGRQKNTQLGILLGVPRVSPEALQKLQSSYSPEQEEAPSGGQAPNLADSQMTGQQKIEYK